MYDKEGKISLVKDDKNILRASHRLKGKGKREVSVRTGDLSNKKDHQIAFAWSKKENKITLYLNGEKVSENIIMNNEIL